MKNASIAMCFLLSTAALAQVPERDETYWKAQQQVEFTRRTAVDAEQKLKEAEQRLREAQAARESAEKQLEKARQQESTAQAAVPAAKARAEASVQAWQDARAEFDRIRKP
ncbi:MAG TPA: hypothetical protein VJU83_02685 [Burkholderiales bacterium]|nr:hypothetical protein [Burkholderiales bacterium]